jgi:signal peptidase I
VNRRTFGCLLELLETFLLVLVIFLVVQQFVAQPYQVEQTSMENTLLPGQFVLVDKLTPRFDSFHRGDVVVFNPPSGWTGDPTGTPYVKRIVGVGGDSVDIHGGHVFINGNQLTEAYLSPTQTTDMPDGKGRTWKLGPDQLFVLGDNRTGSVDSREFGPVDQSYVIGRAWLRYWPISQFGLLSKQAPAASVTPAPSKTP